MRYLSFLALVAALVGCAPVTAEQMYQVTESDLRELESILGAQERRLDELSSVLSSQDQTLLRQSATIVRLQTLVGELQSLSTTQGRTISVLERSSAESAAAAARKINRVTTQRNLVSAGAYAGSVIGAGLGVVVPGFGPIIGSAAGGAIGAAAGWLSSLVVRK